MLVKEDKVSTIPEQLISCFKSYKLNAELIGDYDGEIQIHVSTKIATYMIVLVYLDEYIEWTCSICDIYDQELKCALSSLLEEDTLSTCQDSFSLNTDIQDIVEEIINAMDDKFNQKLFKDLKKFISCIEKLQCVYGQTNIPIGKIVYEIVSGYTP